MPLTLREGNWGKVTVGEPKPLREKLWLFGESPFTWGGIGVLVGAVGVAVSLKVLFIVSGIPLAFGIVRAKFFEGCKIRWQILGNVALGVLMAGLLFGLWGLVPKPKEPVSADDIANAVIKKQKEEVQQSRSTLPAEEQLKPSVVSPSKRQPSKHTFAQVPQQTIPNVTTQPPSVSPQPAKLTISQKSQVSSRQDAPYKTDVVVQTTTEFPSLKMLVQCDKPLVDGSAGIGAGGVMMVTSQGVLKDHPNVFIFTYQSAAPPFGPASPITISLWSKEPIQCNEAATF
jgi:hypothetical protein